MVNIAIVGDIHLHFDEVDVTYFNQSDYDLILFTGDLSNYRPQTGLPIARLIAKINKPVVFIPGNHDTTTIWQLAAEIWQKAWLARLGRLGQSRRVKRLEKALDTAVSTSYAPHHFPQFDLVAARPFSMGGPTLSFKPYLQTRYGISTLDESAERLRQCVDQTQSDRLIFLAHNGPTGLSQAPTDIWGRDFGPMDGNYDFGDLDLEQAVAYAKSKGKEVLAVIAGHLHQRTKSGKQRKWLVKKEGTIYINAARVPRIFEQDRQVLRHHVRLVVAETAVTIEERFIL